MWKIITGVAALAIAAPWASAATATAWQSAANGVACVGASFSASCEFTIPAGVTVLTVTLKGGSGGSNPSLTLSPGGKAAVVTGQINVTPGDVLDVVVGSAAQDVSGSNGGPGGMPGGGAGGTGTADADYPRGELAEVGTRHSSEEHRQSLSQAEAVVADSWEVTAGTQETQTGRVPTEKRYPRLVVGRAEVHLSTLVALAVALAHPVGLLEHQVPRYKVALAEPVHLPAVVAAAAVGSAVVVAVRPTHALPAPVAADPRI